MRSFYGFIVIIKINHFIAKLIISDPVEFHDRTFMTHLKNLPFGDQSFAQRFENVMSTGR